jgi:hypothetical protein
MVGLIADLTQDWRRLDERVAAVSAEIEALAEQDDSCQRLMTVRASLPTPSCSFRSGLNTCQCRFEFPQMCRSKIPQTGGISVISRLAGDRGLHVWVVDRGGAAAVPGLAS